MKTVPNIPQFDGCYTVLVLVATYNHEKYIEDALKGILQQKVDFPYVALVLDDCSTDRTTDIIKRYESQYPNIIKGWYMPENQFSQESSLTPFLLPLINVFQYVAFCEGDDYWIDPLKLQKQVDFMENHNDCTMCFHTVTEHWQDGSAPDKTFYPVEDRIYTGTEIYKQWVVATCSVMIRTSVFKDPQMLNILKNKNLMYYDQSIFMYCSINGGIQGMSDVMSVYRRLKSGYSMRLEKDLKRSYQMIDRYCTHCQTMAEIFGRNLGPEFVRECDSRFVDTAVNGSLLALTNRDFKQAKYFFIRSFHRHAKDTLRILAYRILKYIRDKN